MDVEVKKVQDNTFQAKLMLEEAIEDGLDLAGIQWERNATKLAPVDTGNLRNSIAHRVEDKTLIGGSSVEYAGYQELGTSRMKAANNGRGYLRPAFTDNLNQYIRIIGMAIANRIK